MRAAILFSITVALASAQESSLPTDVAPAATTVPSPPEAAVPLFTEEAVQLTDNVVADLQNDESVAEFAYLFAFEDSPVNETTQSVRRHRVKRFSRCKTSPGDLLWPSKLAWGVFDLLLGGALEPIIPLASPCYPDSEYNNYDAAKCAAISGAWEVDKTQYALFLSL